ncbi:MAG: hypothetical protein KA436_00940 [Oligoflexales bacterium]|nr:hypothetical protein [Oligoflexales bacterium]
MRSSYFLILFLGLLFTSSCTKSGSSPSVDVDAVRQSVKDELSKEAAAKEAELKKLQTAQDGELYIPAEDGSSIHGSGIYLSRSSIPLPKEQNVSIALSEGEPLPVDSLAKELKSAGLSVGAQGVPLVVLATPSVDLTQPMTVLLSPPGDESVVTGLGLADEVKNLDHYIVLYRVQDIKENTTKLGFVSLTGTELAQWAEGKIRFKTRSFGWFQVIRLNAVAPSSGMEIKGGEVLYPIRSKKEDSQTTVVSAAVPDGSAIGDLRSSLVSEDSIEHSLKELVKIIQADLAQPVDVPVVKLQPQSEVISPKDLIKEVLASSVFSLSSSPSPVSTDTKSTSSSEVSTSVEVSTALSVKSQEKSVLAVAAPAASTSSSLASTSPASPADLTVHLSAGLKVLTDCSPFSSLNKDKQYTLEPNTLYTATLCHTNAGSSSTVVTTSTGSSSSPTEAVVSSSVVNSSETELTTPSSVTSSASTVDSTVGSEDVAAPSSTTGTTSIIDPSSNVTTMVTSSVSAVSTEPIPSAPAEAVKAVLTTSPPIVASPEIYAVTTFYSPAVVPIIEKIDDGEKIGEVAVTINTGGNPLDTEYSIIVQGEDPSLSGTYNVAENKVVPTIQGDSWAVLDPKNLNVHYDTPSVVLPSSGSNAGDLASSIASPSTSIPVPEILTPAATTPQSVTPVSEVSTPAVVSGHEAAQTVKTPKVIVKLNLAPDQYFLIFIVARNKTGMKTAGSEEKIFSTATSNDFLSDSSLSIEGAGQAVSLNQRHDSDIPAVDLLLDLEKLQKKKFHLVRVSKSLQKAIGKSGVKKERKDKKDSTSHKRPKNDEDQLALIQEQIKQVKLELEKIDSSKRAQARNYLKNMKNNRRDKSSKDLLKEGEDAKSDKSKDNKDISKTDDKKDKVDSEENKVLTLAEKADKEALEKKAKDELAEKAAFEKAAVEAVVEKAALEKAVLADTATKAERAKADKAAAAAIKAEAKAAAVEKAKAEKAAAKTLAAEKAAAEKAAKAEVAAKAKAEKAAAKAAAQAAADKAKADAKAEKVAAAEKAKAEKAAAKTLAAEKAAAEKAAKTETAAKAKAEKAAAAAQAKAEAKSAADKLAADKAAEKAAAKADAKAAADKLAAEKAVAKAAAAKK